MIKKRNILSGASKESPVNPTAKNPFIFLPKNKKPLRDACCKSCGIYLHPMYPYNECKECRGKFEEVFEDEMFHSFGYEGGLYSRKKIEKIFFKYLGVPNSHEMRFPECDKKVKISAKQGKIVIEKLED